MKNSTKPIFTIGIKKTDGAYVSEFKKKIIPPKTVWCPTTENGTWFMKEGTFVTLTSNCETSAWGRALGNLGIGIDTSIASADEVLNAIQNQEKPQLKDEYNSKLDAISNAETLALTCTDCSKEINRSVYDYSFSKFGKPLCMDCQKKNKKLA